MSLDIDSRIRKGSSGQERASKILTGDPLPVKGVQGVADQIPLFYKYDQRVMMLGRNGKSGDIVLVTGNFDRHWVEHNSRLGLGPGSERIISFDRAELTPLMNRLEKEEEEVPSELFEKAFFEILRLHDGSTPLVVDPYLSTDEAMRFAERLDRLLGVGVRYNGTTTELADRFNNKAEFHDFVSEECDEARVGPYRIIDRRESDLEAEMKKALDDFQIDGNVAVRGEFGTSGSTLWKASMETLDEVLSEMRADEESNRFVVQPFYEVENSLSILGYIDDDGVHLNEYISGQVLKDKKWNGNFFPRQVLSSEKEQIMKSAKEVGEHQMEAGYRGRMQFDFMKPGENTYCERGVHLLAEENARMTGSSAYSALLHDLERRHGEEATVVSYKISDLKGVEDFMDVHDFIGDEVWYDGKSLSGAVPGHFLTGGKQKPGKAEIMFGAVAPRGDKDRLAYIIDSTAGKLGAEQVARDAKESISAE